MAFLTWIWNGIKGLTGIILPAFGKARAGGYIQVLRWTLHFIMVALIVAALWYLNWRFDLEKALRSPWPILHRFWLPLLFLLLYVLSWVGYWLWHLLGPERAATDFPDIDEAWQQALRATRQASIDITEVPLFLILGRLSAEEASFFHAARMLLAVQQTPHGGDAPLHVYSNREAVFVTCAETSLLGKQASVLHARKAVSQPPTTSGSENSNRLAESDKQQSLSDPEPTRVPLRNKELAELVSARLQYLCYLIARERRPYCPINGLVLLFPLAALDNDADASQIATVCQKDLQMVNAVLEVECPIFVVVGDIERAVGFRELIEKLPETRRLDTLGQTFPLLPDIEPEEVPRMIEGGIDHLCEEVLPQTVSRMFLVDHGSIADGSATPGAVLRANMRLYQLVERLRQGRKRLARLITKCTMPDADAPPMIAGCFLAGTGVDAAKEQAFVAGIFRELLLNQNNVSWTPQALNDETSYRRWTRLGYIVMGIFLLAVVAMGFLLATRG